MLLNKKKFQLIFFNSCSKNNETRSSSVDSDGEYENGMPLLRTISHDEHNVPTPGSLRKVSVCVEQLYINKGKSKII